MSLVLVKGKEDVTDSLSHIQMGQLALVIRKENYLETIENAHQIKYYAPSNWIVFQLPIVFLIITVFIFENWLFQKRITKTVKNILN